MSKHTPGPWSCRQEAANVWRIEALNPNGPEFIPISVGTACTTILQTGCRNEDTESNARLFSAAPELLEALERLVADFESEIHNEYDGTSFLDDRLAECDYARAAIAKARGN